MTQQLKTVTATDISDISEAVPRQAWFTIDKRERQPFIFHQWLNSWENVSYSFEYYLQFKENPHRILHINMDDIEQIRISHKMTNTVMTLLIWIIQKSQRYKIK